MSLYKFHKGRVIVTSQDELEYNITKREFMMMQYCVSQDQVYVLNKKAE